MRSIATGIVVMLSAVIPVSLPIVLVVSQGIWAAAAVNHETFGVHFTAYPTLALGYHFIGNAMGFAAVYAYLPSFLVHRVLTLSEFDRFQVWWVLVFTIHAILIVGLAIWIARLPLPVLGKVALVLVVGALPHYLGAGYANLLTPNYHLIEAVLYLLAAALVVLTLQGKLRAGWKTALVAGIAVAVAFWSKFTLLVTVGAFYGLVVALGGWCGLGRRIAISGAAFVGATIVLAAIYFVGNVPNALQFAHDLPDMYTSDFLNQRFPPLYDELTNWRATISTFQNTFRLWLIAMVGGVIWTIFHRSPQRLAFLGCTLLISAFFVRFLLTRTAPNTFVDAVLFASFIIGIWVADWSSSRWWQIASVGLLALYVWFVGQTTWRMVGEDRYPAWIDGLQAASASAREIDDDIQSRPQLPIVYYWPGPLDALFPSTYLYNLFSGNQITKQVYLKRYSPRSSLRTPPEGVQRGAHVLVLPLHIGPGYDRLTQPRPSDTPVLDLYPSFGHLLEDPSQDCRRHQVWTPIIDYAADTSKSVLVCTVSEAGVPRYDETDSPPPDGTVDLALGRPVTAGGGPIQHPVELAVDGLTSEQGTTPTTAAIAASWQPWLEVDLGDERDIAAVQLWGRTGSCCATSLRNVYIFTSAEPIGTGDARAVRTAPGVTSHYLDGSVHTPTRVPIDERARYVRLQVADGNVLELTEIQVWGKPGTP